MVGTREKRARLVPEMVDKDSKSRQHRNQVHIGGGEDWNRGILGLNPKKI